MNILVTGASGLLGGHLVAGLSDCHSVVGVDREPWWGDRPAQIVCGDLMSPAFVHQTIAATRPEVIIHCAAMVNVDACERDPTAASAYNTEMTRIVARAALPGCLLVYITTDGIFAGDHRFASEDEAPAPRTVYGRTKLDGEREVANATPNHLIVRTNFYGWSSGRKATSAEWLFHALQAGEAITAFDDFFFTPMYVVDFVERLHRLIRSAERGVVHVCGAERVSKYEFALRMAAHGSLSVAAVRRGSIDDARLAAPRPKDMSLSCRRAERLLGPMPDCTAGLIRFLAHRNVPLGRRFDVAASARDAER